MGHYIDKDNLEAFLNELIENLGDSEYDMGYLCAIDSIFGCYLNSLEVKEVDFWHLQSKEDIDNVLVDWGLHTFVYLMKDGTIQKFSGIQAECYDGTINKHLDCADDNYEWVLRSIEAEEQMRRTRALHQRLNKIEL